MVCRDANTHRAREVNPLVRSTPEEHSLYAIGERAFPFLFDATPSNQSHCTELKQRRQSVALRSLSRVPPSSAEAEALHSFYLKHGQHEAKDAQDANEEGRVWMGYTGLEKCMIMFPQERK